MTTLFEINGKKLETIWLGPPPDQAPTLVFLHEGLGSAQHWRSFPEKLVQATGCGALVYSRLGYGLSDPCELPRPATYLHHEAQDVLPPLLEAFKIQDCILIGHSDGGSIALIYGGEDTAVNLLGIITEAAHVFNEEVCISAIKESKQAYLHTDMREKLLKYHQHVDIAYWGWHDVWISDEFAQFNIEEYLPHIQVPMLIIQGEDDPFGTLKQVEAIQAQTICSVETLILPDCEHTPHKQQKEATLLAMTNFVQKLLS